MTVFPQRLFDSDQFTSVQELQYFMANSCFKDWIGEDEIYEDLYIFLLSVRSAILPLLLSH